ncbi:MAG TPA: hypothetical protein VF281_01080 [Candidatus Saccharimonadales bacterium]
MNSTATSVRPVLAAVLNFLIPGVGYLYLGVRKKFAWLLVGASIVSAVAIVMNVLNPQTMMSQYANTMTQYSILDSLAIFIVAVAFAYDAYTEAKAHLK